MKLFFRPNIPLLSLLALFLQASIAPAQTIEYVNSGLWTGVPDVEVVGPYAFCSYHNGLVILDVSNPGSPQLHSKLLCPSQSRGEGLDVEGNFAYLADGDAGLCVIDISNPAAPVLAACWDSPGFAMDVCFYDHYVFIADWWQGMQIVDVADPSNPQWIGGYDTDSGSWGIHVANGHAFMADGEQGVRVFDVSNVANPVLLATIPVNRFAHDVQAVGDYLYIASSDNNEAGLTIVNIANPAAPDVVGHYHSWRATSVKVSGTLVYLTDLTQGLRILNVTNPQNPVQLGWWQAPDFADALGVYVVNDIAYLAVGNSQETTFGTYNTGLFLLDVADPANPTQIGHYNSSGLLENIVISGDHAYLAANDPAFHVVNVADPLNLSSVGMGIWESNLSRNLAVADGYAYVVSSIRGMNVYDISNPAGPDSIAHYDGIAGYNAIEVNGPVAYLLTGSSLWLIDVAHLPDLTLIGSVYLSDQTFDIAVKDNYVYVAGLSGLVIIDATISTDPVIINNYPLPCGRITVRENTAYLATTDTHCVLLNISDPMDIAEISSIPLLAAAMCIEPQGEYLWIAEGGAGIQVFDLSNPAFPEAIDHYDTPGHARSIAIKDSIAYVVDQYSLLAFTLSQESGSIRIKPLLPSRLSLSQNFPNPFNAATRLDFFLDRSGDTQIVIHDLLGREVARPVNGFFERGSHSIYWSASNLPGGTYFAVLSQGHQFTSIKLMLLK